MTNKAYNKLMNALVKQREEVSQSKEAAQKLLTDLGVYKILAKYKYDGKIETVSDSK